MVGRLEISTTRARIDFSSQYLKLDIQQPHAQLYIQTRRGELRVESEPPQLQVDSTQCRIDEGIIPISVAIAQDAQEGMQALLDYASAQTQEGHYILKNFHADKHAFATIAMNKVMPEPRQSKMVFIPSQPPEISFTDPVFEVENIPGTTDISWSVYPRAEVEVAQYNKLDIWMEQYPSISYNYIEPPSLDVLA